MPASQPPARRETYRRNTALEELLAEINGLLAPADERLQASAPDAPRHPIVLVVGPPRCGSTVAMQWLASSGAFGYPTNLLSRFYGAPAVGAKVQRLLTDPLYNFRDELADLTGGGPSFQSSLGKTQGTLAPNEFWYFWRRFLPSVEPRHLTPDDVAEIDGEGLRRSLAALEAALDRPLAMKGHMLELNLDVADRLLPRLVVLHIRRDLMYNTQSLLRAREAYFGTRDAWYSVRPREADALEALDPLRQVAGQVFFIDRAIRRALAGMADHRYLSVPYESFCAAPEAVYRQLAERFEAQGTALPPVYEGPASFDSTNRAVLPDEELAVIREALDAFASDPDSILPNA